MNSNLVITIGRSFGSGGREIGKALAAELDMKYYDKEILADAAKESGLDEGYIRLFDEQKPSFNFFSSMASSVLGDESQMEVKLQTMQHQVIGTDYISGLTETIIEQLQIFLKFRFEKTVKFRYN